jgi:hypothetical protein
MMVRLSRDQEQLFYSFRLDEVVPDDHLVRDVVAPQLADVYPQFAKSVFGIAGAAPPS